MSSLLQLEARISARLIDPANTVFSLATIDEALRTALAEYSEALPQSDEGILTLPGTGREIALDSFAGLIQVLDVWWPFDPVTEVWPPNQVAGFRLWWDDARPVLMLSSKTGNQPQLNDTLRLWYTKPQTISSLDGAVVTTVMPQHESGLVTGAAGYAVASEMRHQIGSIHVDPNQVASLNQWATDQLLEFDGWLALVSANAPSSGAPFGQGWGIDKWDGNRDNRQPRSWPWQ
jgi:hypothetical protein